MAVAVVPGSSAVVAITLLLKGVCINDVALIDPVVAVVTWVVDGSNDLTVASSLLMADVCNTVVAGYKPGQDGWILVVTAAVAIASDPEVSDKYPVAVAIVDAVATRIVVAWFVMYVALSVLVVAEGEMS